MSKPEKWVVREQITHWKYWLNYPENRDRLYGSLYRQADAKILEFLHTGRPYRVQYEQVQQVGSNPLMPADARYGGVDQVIYEFQLLVSIQEIEPEWQYRPEYWRE